MKKYRVQAGDNLLKIANQFDITVDDILSVNDIENSDVIYVDQTIKIPENEDEKNDNTGGGVDIEIRPVFKEFDASHVLTGSIIKALSEQELLIRTLYGEARGTPREDMELIAHTIINRAEADSGRFSDDNSIKQVVLKNADNPKKSNQFMAWGNIYDPDGPGENHKETRRNKLGYHPVAKEVTAHRQKVINMIFEATKKALNRKESPIPGVYNYLAVGYDNKPYTEWDEDNIVTSVKGTSDDFWAVGMEVVEWVKNGHAFLRSR